MYLAPLIDSVMDAILVVDEQQRIVVFNRAAECVFGCPASEAMGQALNKFIPERFHRAHEQHVQRYMRNGATTRSMASPGQIAGLCADGTEFPAEATVAHGESGGKKFCAVVLRDITERLRAAELRQMFEKAQREEESRLYEHEIEIAASLQRRLISSVFPQVPFATVRGETRPCREVGGDFFEVMTTDKGLAVVLADACGKGISAALLMANLQAALRSNVIQFFKDSAVPAQNPDGAVSRVVKTLNDQICSYTSANKYASFFFAVYDEGDGNFTYCNAGHNPPLYFNGGECRRLTTGGTVVGIFPDAEYDQECVRFHPGDLFLAYTDGIIECVNEYGEEFGEERLVRLAQENRNKPAAEIQKLVVDEVLNWAYEEERDDDMTLIVARMR